MANVLLVDDDEIILKAVSACLIKGGHTVVKAKEGHTALEKARNETFNLIVTDINLPMGISGFTLVKTLREDRNLMRIPVILISSRRSKADVIKGIDLGVDDYVIKPIDFDLFAAKVNSLLERGAHTFVPSRINHVGKVRLHVTLEIVAISEEGLQLISPHPMEINEKLEVESDIYDEIGMLIPVLRVAHCEPLETDTHLYSIKANFIGLNPAEMQNVRKFILRARVAGKQAS